MLYYYIKIKLSLKILFSFNENLMVIAYNRSQGRNRGVFFMKILIVEDQTDLADALAQMLNNEGFITNAVYDGEEGLYEALTDTYDMIVLDVMLPNMNGFDILSRIRKNKIGSAVLMLTALSQDEDKVRGFEIGADDYLTKPFSKSEFTARVKALARRSRNAYVPDDLSFGNIVLSSTKHEICCGSQSIALGTKEYQFLELLMINHGIIIPKERFVERIWGFDAETEYNNVAVYISFLRKKLSAIGADISINAVKGAGYILEEKK